MDTTLLIMAAGMGSRFGGGIKQLAPVGPNGEIIMDYSIHDAIEAGFNKVVFVIREDILTAFQEAIGNRIETICAKAGVKVAYAFQDMNNIPAGNTVPEGRTKPWGTAHAVLCAAEEIGDRPFAVLNADDYYGKSAFKVIYNALVDNAKPNHYFMVGYELGKTVTDAGSVARGVCVTDENHYLTAIAERTRIEKYEDGIHYTEDGEVWHDLPENTPVSMNFWGFMPSYLDAIRERFPSFLENAIAANPMKGEFYLPVLVDELMRADRATVQVLASADRWFGVTYAADKPGVVAALKDMAQQGKYPDGLWG